MTPPFTVRRGAWEVLKGTQLPKPDIYPLRVYVGSERTFLNAGAEIDIAQLRDECASIVARLAPFVPGDADGRGAFVIVVTPDSFSSVDVAESESSGGG